MWDRQELKMRGKMAFKRNYASAVAVSLLMGIISLLFGGGSGSSGSSEYSTNFGDNDFSFSYNHNAGLFAGILTAFVLVMLFIGMILSIFVENVLEVGGCRFFIQNQSGRPGIGVLLDGFRSGHYGNLVLTLFLRNLYIVLWSCLLVVPGIVKSYEYMMVSYILAENPGMDRKEAFLISKEMMNGQKWQAFVLDLSFIGWYLLSILSCGILAVFYVDPYVNATHAELYSFNKAKAYREGYIR